MKTGRFFGLNGHTSALLFKAFPVTENTGNPPPIRAPRTRRSFRCLLRYGCFCMGDLFHHALIGTVGKVHKQTSVNVQPNPPPFPSHGKGCGSGGYTPAAPPGNRTAGAASQGQATAKAAVLCTLDRQLPAVLNDMRRRGIYHPEPCLGEVVCDNLSQSSNKI